MSQINGRLALCSKTFPKVKVKSIPMLWIPNWPETKARLTLRKWFVLKTIFPEVMLWKKPASSHLVPPVPSSSPGGLQQNLPYLKKMLQGFPGGSSGKESACQCRGRGFDPWSQKISHASGATKPVRHNDWACALEPTSRNYYCLLTLEPLLRNKRDHRSEKPVHCNRVVPSPCN